MHTTGHRAAEVIMVPDGSVVWQGYRHGPGVLLVQSQDEAVQDAADLIHDYLSGYLGKLAFVGGGTAACVYKSSDSYRYDRFAIKRFFDTSYLADNNYGLSGLRANVITETGLRRISASNTRVQAEIAAALDDPSLVPVNTDLSFTAPTMYAAYLPDPESEMDAVWVMSFEEGAMPHKSRLRPWLPHEYWRAHFYGLALGTCGATLADIDLEDVDLNMLLRESCTGGLEVVKLDERARYDRLLDF